MAIEKRYLKNILFIIVLFVFTFHPSFAATTQSPASAAKKTSAQIKKSQPAAQKKKLNTQKKKLAAQKRKTAAQRKKPSTTKKPVLKKTKKKTMQKKVIPKKKKPARQVPRPTAKKVTAKPPARINTTNITKAHLPGYSLTAIEKTLVNAVRKTIANVRYTAYKLGGTRIDTSRGIYVVDCSTYVDHVLKSVYPRAFTSLTHWSGSIKPTTSDFYQYFTNLSDTSQTHWNTIEDVEQLRPGDILVFRYKTKLGNERGGHVMIVMDQPIWQRDAYLVRIADSAPTGHSTDTRMPHASGIGIGSILLKVDPKTYQPYAYAWKVGSRWQKNVNFAMARPIHVN